VRKHSGRVAGRYLSQFLLCRLPCRSRCGYVRAQTRRRRSQRIIEHGQAAGEGSARPIGHIAGELLPHHSFCLHQPTARLSQVNGLLRRLRCVHQPPDRECAHGQDSLAQLGIIKGRAVVLERCHHSTRLTHHSNYPARWGDPCGQSRRGHKGQARRQPVQQAKLRVPNRPREPPFQRERVPRLTKLDHEPGETAIRRDPRRAGRKYRNAASRHGDGYQRLKRRPSPSYRLEQAGGAKHDTQDSSCQPRRPHGIAAHIQERGSGQTGARRRGQPADPGECRKRANPGGGSHGTRKEAGRRGTRRP